MRPARPSFILARVASLALAAGLLAAPQAARAGEDAEPLRLRGSTHDEALPTTHAPPSRPTAAREDAAPYWRGGATHPRGEHLREALEGALRTNPKLDAARHDAEAANWGVWKEGAGFLPTVSLGGRFTRGTLATTTQANLQPLQNKRVGTLTLNMPLLAGGQTVYAIKSAASLASAAALESRAVSSDVALETVTAYLQYLLAERTTTIVKATSMRMKRLVEAMRMRRDAGFASDADVAQIVAEDASLSQQLADARIGADKARIQAESLAGRPVVFRADLPSLEKHLPSGPDAAAAMAAGRNPRVAAASHNAQAALYSSRATFGRLLPRLDLVGQMQRDYDPAPLVKPDAWQVALQLSVPLMDAGSFLEYRQKRETATATQLRADDADRQARAQGESLMRQYRGEGARLKASSVRARSLLRVADTFDKMFEAGLAPLDTVLEKYRMLAQAQIDLEQTTMQRYLAACQLLALVGALETSMLVASR